MIITFNERSIMTNYRTVVPGMQDGDNDNSTNQQVGRRKVNQQERGAQNSQGDQNGTRVPGMESDSTTHQEQRSNKPLVGFLISVSRKEEGEFWVLRQGQNVIGSGTNCNVVLAEASVSGVHAVLAIHRNPNDGNKISVGIIDKGSSNGTFVNDNYIGFNPCQCMSYDRIKIGNYELLLILFDAVEYNMKKSEEFVSKEDFDYADRDMYSTNDGTRF